jgi:NAD+ synthase (glutamine-hydrolysing)
LRSIPFSFQPADVIYRLKRDIEKQPFVPSDLEKRNERCYEVYNIQVSSLAQRIRSSGIKKLVIGVSGGLDSTHALIVACRTMDRLGLPRSNILAYTMPAYATSALTKSSAIDLMKALGVTWQVLDIVPSCDRMLADIGHPYASGKKVYDITFENVQAGIHPPLIIAM